MEFVLREVKTGGNGHRSLHTHFQPFVHNSYRLLVVVEDGVVHRVVISDLLWLFDSLLLVICIAAKL